MRRESGLVGGGERKTEYRKKESKEIKERKRSEK